MLFNLFIYCLCHIDIEIIAIHTYTTSTQISWSALPEYYTYEVGIIGPIGSLSTLPQDYTSYANTTDWTIEVTGLEPNTCYVFGVRAHSTITYLPGDWTVVHNITQPLGEFHLKIHYFPHRSSQ